MSRTKVTPPDQISPSMIEEIVQRLRRNRPVRTRFAPWGRVHIDRQLPFLCLYRRPPGRPDPGTDHLLLGEASYLLADGGMPHELLKELVKAIVRPQGEAFGAFLLLELWAGQEKDCTFRIHAPKLRVPSFLLEVMETALLDIPIEGADIRVGLRYGQRWAPPGLERLFSEGELGGLGAVMMGLEVKPVFRDPQSAELFPFELKALRQGLAKALKKAFFLFSHDYTSHRPIHYAELGARTFTSAVREVDRRLADIDRRFDLLLHVTPVNTEAAWNQLKGSGFGRAPEFLYRPRNIDPSLLKRQLHAIALERIEDPTLAHLFETKRDELDRQLTMVEDRGTKRFLRGSQQVYGELDPDLLCLARELLDRLPPRARDDHASRSLDAEAFARRAQEELAHYRSQDPSLASAVTIRADVPGLMVSRGQFLVGRSASVAEARTEATLAHELGTHVLTHHNGRSQPFAQLHTGMARYESLQEGLGVLAEYLVGGLSRPRLRLLAGRVLAVHCLSEGASFVETFRTLWRSEGFRQKDAFMIAMRVYRGGGLTKDAIYLEGLVKLIDYLSQGGDLELLYLGKVAFEHLSIIEELRWRQILSPGPLRPLYLDRPGVASRLERVRRGISVVDLVEVHLG